MKILKDRTVTKAPLLDPPCFWRSNTIRDPSMYAMHLGGSENRIQHINAVYLAYWVFQRQNVLPFAFEMLLDDFSFYSSEILSVFWSYYRINVGESQFHIKLLVEVAICQMTP